VAIDTAKLRAGSGVGYDRGGRSEEVENGVLVVGLNTEDGALREREGFGWREGVSCGRS